MHCRDATAISPGSITGRLTRRPQFLAVRGGRKLRGEFFLLEARRTRPEDEPARIGYTVTRKCGNAVERNRIRRRLKAAMRQVGGRDMAGGTDYVIVARRDVLGVRFDALVSELSRRIRAAKPAGSN